MEGNDLDHIQFVGIIAAPAAATNDSDRLRLATSSGRNTVGDLFESLTGRRRGDLGYVLVATSIESHD